jgi:hypothetical protein
MGIIGRLYARTKKCVVVISRKTLTFVSLAVLCYEMWEITNTAGIAYQIRGSEALELGECRRFQGIA